MLIVHPSSQCDVCLDAYTWTTPAKSPHAIQCGHTFCYDCLRTVNPSNCPMCRKAFNPERIKKLHIDRAPDGPFPTGAGPMAEEHDLLRRIGVLFNQDADPHDVDALIRHTSEWLENHRGPTHLPLQRAMYALHDIQFLRIEQARTKDAFERMRANHERNADLKQRDLEIARTVEDRLLQQQREYDSYIKRLSDELSTLRQQNISMQSELSRYTTSSNPLPRPPEQIPIPIVTSLSREPVHPSQQSAAQLGLGLPTAVAPSSQSRTSSNGSSGSNGSRRRVSSVRFADPVLPDDREQGSRHRAPGEDLRPEKTRRSHLIVPGASYSQRVIPPPLDGSDIDVTPRPPVNQGTNPVYSGPRITDRLMWFSGFESPRELTNSEKMMIPQLRQPPTNSNPVSSTVVPSVAPSLTAGQQPPPVVPLPPVIQPSIAAGPAAETGSARIQHIAPEPPIIGRDAYALRQGPANKEGYVAAYLPHMGGIGWIRQEDAAQLPVRARGTESQHAYVIAKEPSEVDDEWGRQGESSHYTLGLTGVPEAPVASSSRSVIQQAQYTALPESSTATSALFRDMPTTAERAAPASANSSSVSLSGMPILAAPQRTAGRDVNATEPPSLDLNLTTLPMPQAPQTSQEPPSTPSAASSWGTVESRNDSLGDLQLNNFGDPVPYTGPQSLEQLPIGELTGGPIVLTDLVTPRQGSSILDGGHSSSGRSVDHHTEASAPTGMLLNPSSGSSRVVASVDDLEEVNRSLQRVAEAQSRESSRRHSRQPSNHSLSARDDNWVMVGSRTGLALYSSRPSQPSSNIPSTGLSPNEQSSPVESRPRSGASRAETTISRQTSHSHHSSYSAHTSASHHSSSDRHRARRASNASLLHGPPEPAATWRVSDNQPYGSPGVPYDPESRPPPSQESIPRSLQSNGDGLGLTFEAPSTSSAVTGNGEQAAGIHAPRPVAGRRASQLISSIWNARSGR